MMSIICTISISIIMIIMNMIIHICMITSPPFRSPICFRMLVGHFTMENDSLCKSPRFSAKLPQKLRRRMSKSWLAKCPSVAQLLQDAGDLAAGRRVAGALRSWLVTYDLLVLLLSSS